MMQNSYIKNKSKDNNNSNMCNTKVLLRESNCCKRLIKVCLKVYKSTNFNTNNHSIPGSDISKLIF